MARKRKSGVTARQDSEARDVKDDQDSDEPIALREDAEECDEGARAADLDENALMRGTCATETRIGEKGERLILLYSHVRALLYCTLLYTITRTLDSIINVYMYTPALHAVLSQRVVARASPLESHSPCAPPCISLVALTESPLIRLRRNLVKRSEKKFHDERVRFERVRRARRVAVCGFRKSLIHPTVLVGWENV